MITFINTYVSRKKTGNLVALTLSKSLKVSLKLVTNTLFGGSNVLIYKIALSTQVAIFTRIHKKLQEKDGKGSMMRGLLNTFERSCSASWISPHIGDLKAKKLLQRPILQAVPGVSPWKPRIPTHKGLSAKPCSN